MSTNKNSVNPADAAELAGIPRKALGEKVTPLRDKRGEIIAALDFLITGI